MRSTSPVTGTEGHTAGPDQDEDNILFTMERMFNHACSPSSIRKELKKQRLGQDITPAIHKLALKFKRERHTSSQDCSLQTARAILTVIMEAEFQTIEDLLRLCKLNGKKLTDAR